MKLLFEKQQIINEKRHGAFSDPNKERVFRLEILSDWLTLYEEVMHLQRQVYQLEGIVTELENEKDT